MKNIQSHRNQALRVKTSLRAGGGDSKPAVVTPPPLPNGGRQPNDGNV